MTCLEWNQFACSDMISRGSWQAGHDGMAGVAGIVRLA